MGSRTVLYDAHTASGGRMVPFAGWDMPLHYGSQIQEHHAVRQDAGMFDVSHMGIVDLHGPRVTDLLRYLLANNVDRLTAPGKALYSCMLKPSGGVMDDLIVYHLEPGWFRLVVNAATRDRDLTWIREHARGFDVDVRERADLAMIAVQGPNARARALTLLAPDLSAESTELKRFFAARAGDWLVARTGYTGEDGFEVMLPAKAAQDFWTALASAGVAPCGLGARDTLRLEAGMSLYGTDMDETVTPLESGLGWTVAWDPPERAFIGREALERQRDAGNLRRFVGLLLMDKGVLRNHLPVSLAGVGVGEITSGGFSPTLGRSIALARLAPGDEESYQVEIRGRRLAVRVVKPPFVRDGKVRVDL